MIKQGLTIGVINLVVGMVINQGLQILFPELAKEYQGGFFRPWSDPLMMLFFLYPFILGLALSFLWQMISKQIQGKTRSDRAWNFAKFYFLIATVPGMFISWTSFQISSLMIGSWTLAGLAEIWVAGWILAKN